MYGLKDSTLQIIIQEMQQHEEIQEAIIFGSRAKGTYQNGSDIDIAIKGPKISHQLLTSLSRKLNQETPIPHHVDIVYYDQITNQDLIEHIHRVGQPLPIAKH